MKIEDHMIENIRIKRNTERICTFTTIFQFLLLQEHLRAALADLNDGFTANSYQQHLIRRKHGSTERKKSLLYEKG